MCQYTNETASEKAHSAYTNAEVDTKDSQYHLRLSSRDALVSGEYNQRSNQPRGAWNLKL